jgi:hypothetical protein
MNRYENCLPVDYPMLYPSEIATILINQSLIFLGDSVVAQEECNLRCLLSEYHINKVVIQYEHNIAISYYKFLGNISIGYRNYGLPWPNMTLPTLKSVIENSTIVVLNIGNHYTDALKMTRDLMILYNVIYHDISPTIRPLLTFRLQNPVHFPTNTGEYDSAGHYYNCTNITNEQHHKSFRYQTGLNFVKKFHIPYYDIVKITNYPHFHPPLKVPIDCLHFAQDTWIITAVNSVFARLLQLCHEHRMNH